MTTRFGIAEWYGHPLLALSAQDRRVLARKALREESGTPPCLFQEGRPPCRKRGGVCSLRRYQEGERGRIAQAVEDPVVVCPARFEEGQMLVGWLAEIVGFSAAKTKLAREVPFMEGTTTGKPAGKIDMGWPELPTVISTGTALRFRRYISRAGAWTPSIRHCETMTVPSPRFRERSAGRIGDPRAPSASCHNFRSKCPPCEGGAPSWPWLWIGLSLIPWEGRVPIQATI